MRTAFMTQSMQKVKSKSTADAHNLNQYTAKYSNIQDFADPAQSNY
jgi:hypothetical protein